MVFRFEEHGQPAAARGRQANTRRLRRAAWRRDRTDAVFSGERAWLAGNAEPGRTESNPETPGAPLADAGCRSDLRHAAVDAQFRAGDKTAIVGREE
jgi:hypothetical protein